MYAMFVPTLAHRDAAVKRATRMTDLNGKVGQRQLEEDEIIAFADDFHFHLIGPCAEKAARCLKQVVAESGPKLGDPRLIKTLSMDQQKCIKAAGFAPAIRLSPEGHPCLSFDARCWNDVQNALGRYDLGVASDDAKGQALKKQCSLRVIVTDVFA